MALKWETTKKTQKGALGKEKKTWEWGVRRRVGIRRRVENSVGCLSEKRLFINSGKRVDE